MKNITRGVNLGVLLIFIAWTSFAQVLNFSGAWKLNTSKSEFPDSLSISEMTWDVRQEGIVLNVEKTIKGEVNTRHYTTDRKEFINAGSYFDDLKGTAWFASDTLTIKTEEEVRTVSYAPEFPDGNISYSKTMTTEEWSLSADEKMLTVVQIFTMPDGRSESMKLVFEKVRGLGSWPFNR